MIVQCMTCLPRGAWLYAVAAVAAFCGFQQMDLYQTAPQSYLLLEAVLKGRFLDFYAYASEAYMTPAYNICIYLLFAVWNLPLFLVGILFDFAMPATLVVFYDKLLLVLFFFWGAARLADAGKALELPETWRRWLFIAFLTSPFAFFSVFMFGGYDIFSAVFTLCAITELLRGRLWRFTLIIGFAACFKNFALLVYLPLLLLEEKRLRRLICHIAVALLPLLVTRVLFLSDPTLAERAAFENGFWARFFESTFSGGVYPVSFFTAGYALVCLWAYGFVPGGEQERRGAAVYLPFLTFGMFFLTVSWHPQWLLLLVPYWLLCQAQSRRGGCREAALEVVAFAAFCAVVGITCFNGVDHRLLRDGVAGMVFGTLYDSQALEMRELFGGAATLDLFKILFNSVLLFLIWRLRPFHNDGGAAEPVSGTAACRCGAVLFFVLPALFCFGWSAMREHEVLRRFEFTGGQLGWSVGDEDSSGSRPESAGVFDRSASPVLMPDIAGARLIAGGELVAGSEYISSLLPPVSPGPRGLGVRFAVAPRHPVELEVLSPRGETVFRGTIKPEAVGKNGYAQILFPARPAPEAYRLRFTSGAPAGSGPQLLLLQSPSGVTAADCRQLL